MSKEKRIISNLTLLFACSTLISQSLMDLFASIFGIASFFFIFKFRKREFIEFYNKLRSLNLIILFWILVVAIGFILNEKPPTQPNPYFWLVRLLEFRWVLLLYICFFWMSQFGLSEKVTKIWILFAGVTSFGSIIHFLYNFRFGADPISRLEGPFQFPMTHAHVYGPYFCLLLGIFLFSYRHLSKIIAGLLLASTLAVGLSVAMTLTRGIWIGVFVALLVVGCVWDFRKGLLIFLLTALLGSSLYFVSPAIKARVDFTLRFFSNDATITRTYDDERVILWKTNLELFREHPILGIGYGQNKYYLRAKYDKQGLPPNQFESHAHNQYIQFLSGTGVLGLIGYLAWILFILKVNIKGLNSVANEKWAQKGLLVGTLGAQICYLVGGLTESNFEHSKVRYAMLLIWALALWSSGQLSSAPKFFISDKKA